MTNKKQQNRKPIQLDPKVLDQLMKIKQQTKAHSLSEVVANLIQDNDSKKSLEKRVKIMEAKINKILESVASPECVLDCEETTIDKPKWKVKEIKENQ